MDKPTVVRGLQKKAWRLRGKSLLPTAFIHIPVRSLLDSQSWPWPNPPCGSVRRSRARPSLFAVRFELSDWANTGRWLIQLLRVLQLAEFTTTTHKHRTREPRCNRSPLFSFLFLSCDATRRPSAQAYLLRAPSTASRFAPFTWST